jgi:ribosomal-protein-alanine N-acetyltransferase
LNLIPFTTAICEHVLNNDFSDLARLNLVRGKSWPNQDVMETLPRIIENLSRVELPTGFESWMIVKNDTLEIIGDAGFKGLDMTNSSLDLGYGIIVEERGQGYATEAARALVRWALSQTVVRKITANCETSNLNSAKLLRKLGFTEVKLAEGSTYWSLM